MHLDSVTILNQFCFIVFVDCFLVTDHKVAKECRE